MPKRTRFIVFPAPVMFSDLKAFDSVALHLPYHSLQFPVTVVSNQVCDVIDLVDLQVSPRLNDRVQYHGAESYTTA